MTESQHEVAADAASGEGLMDDSADTALQRMKSEHPYYCEEGYQFLEFTSWAAFVADMGDANEDYNLLFRFDWLSYDDANLGDVLQLSYVQQRRGRYECCLVDVTNDDAPAVEEWLRGKFEHMLRLWAPFVAMHSQQHSGRPDA